MISPAVKKIVECVEGNCKETYCNPQTGQEITPEQASIVMRENSALKAIKDNYPYMAVFAGTCGYVAFRLYKAYQAGQKQ